MKLLNRYFKGILNLELSKSKFLNVYIFMGKMIYKFAHKPIQLANVNKIINFKN